MQPLLRPQPATRARAARSPQSARSLGPLARVAWLPALAGALVPKCPMCVAAYLSAIGAGASAASAAAPAIVRAGHVAVILAVAVLGARLLVRARRARRYRGLAPFAVCAVALLAAEFAAPTLLWPRLLALAGVAVAVVLAERAAASRCACVARATSAPQSPHPLIRLAAEQQRAQLLCLIERESLQLLSER